MAKFKDNGKLKLLIIVGTRPEIIRLAAVINKCREYFDCLLAHTGQNYDYNLNGVFFKDLKLKETVPYSEEKDAAFFTASIQPIEMTLGDGFFAIFFPQDGHMPQLSVDELKMVKKVVVKVEIN